MDKIIFIDTRIRVEKRENNELYFIPEVLIYNNTLDWDDRQLLQRKHGGYSPEFEEFLNLYLELYGKTIEWCVISKTRSYYRRDYTSLHRIYGQMDQKKIGFKTLKTAKGAIDAFKEKYKNCF